MTVSYCPACTLDHFHYIVTEDIVIMDCALGMEPMTRLLGGWVSKELRHDRHTVSLLTNHMVFSPKYRGKVLVGDVAMVAEAIMRKTCKERY